MTEEFELAMLDLDSCVGRLARTQALKHPELIALKELYIKMRPFLASEDYMGAVNFMNEAKELTNDFTLPEDADSNFKKAYNAFKVIELEIL